METLNEIYFLINNFKMCMVFYKIMQTYIILIMLIGKVKLRGNKLDGFN